MTTQTQREKVKQIYALVALTAIALTGCGPGTQASSSATASAETSASPSLRSTSTPTVMSAPQAGTYYLAAVCPGNILGDKTMATMQAKPLDLQAAKRDTAALRDSYRKAIETLSDEKVLWPETIKADVATLVEGMYSELGAAQNVANQNTEANLIAAWNAWVTPPSQGATAQKIRLKLGLSSDTSSSCTPS